jgi:ELWxxDGT repeat protein
MGCWGAELWRSDGTEAGTVLVKDIAAGTRSSQPQGLTVVETAPGVYRVFFAANDGVSGFELWQSDGTETGTVLVRGHSIGGREFGAATTNCPGESGGVSGQ